MENEEKLYVLSNTKFMKWIKKRLGEHYYIDDHDSKMDENDLFYANKIKYLYEVIMEYANANNIKPTNYMQYDLYYVNYENHIFFVYKGANSYGCFNNTLDKKDILYCIDFDEVRNSKIEDIISCENDVFSNLKEEVISLHKKGISLDFIKEIIKELVNNIDKKEKVKKKVK